MERYCFYTRVSKRDQDINRQLYILERYIDNNNIKNYFFIQEKESTLKNRPLKQAVMNQMRKGEIDVIVVTRLDRFARSLVELVLSVEEIIKRGHTFISVQEGICWTRKDYGPSEQLQLNMFASIAQFYRDNQGERIREGLERKKRMRELGEIRRKAYKGKKKG